MCWLSTTAFAFKVAPTRPLLTTAPEEVLATHDSLHRLVVKAGKGNPPGDVAYDLSSVGDIDPGGLLLMMYSAEILHERNWTPFAIGNSPSMRKLKRNLEHLNLSPTQRNDFAKDVGEYPMREVSDPGRMVVELEEWSATVRHGAGLKEEDVARWGGQISEVVTNGFQHGPTGLEGRMRPILLAGGVDRDHRIVRLSALDRGSGIPRVIGPHVADSIRNKGDGRLIREACKNGVTSHCSRQNQGHGLPHLIDSVNENGGTLQIFSDRGFVFVKDKKIKARSFKKSERSIKGTLTLITLRF